MDKKDIEKVPKNDIKQEKKVKEKETKTETKAKTNNEVKNEIKTEAKSEINKDASKEVQKKGNKKVLIIIIICVVILGVATGITYILTDGFDFSSNSNTDSDSKDKDDEKDNKKDNKDKDKDDEDDNDKDDDEDKKDDKDDKNKFYLDLVSIENFDKNGNAIVKGRVTNGADTTASVKYYVVNDKLEVLNEVKDYENYSWKDGYALIKSNSATENSYVINYKGERVFEAKPGEYKNITLMSNAHLVLVKQSDTFNSSKTEAGVYDINLKKMVLDFDEKYYQSYYEDYGDDTIFLDFKIIFNTRTNKLVTYQDNIGLEFSDGYSTDAGYDSNYNNTLDIFSDAGAFKKVPLPKEITLYCKNHTNGICFDHDGIHHFENNTWNFYSFLVDLANGTLVELGEDYYNISNKVLFNKNGYALLIFENNGDIQYYTVIDKTGKRMFEPVRVNDNTTTLKINESAELSDSNNFIVSDGNKTFVMNYKNELVVKPKDNDTFNSIIGNYVKVTNNNRISLKDFKGNEVKIEIKKNLK